MDLIKEWKRDEEWASRCWSRKSGRRTETLREHQRRIIEVWQQLMEENGVQESMGRILRDHWLEENGKRVEFSLEWVQYLYELWQKGVYYHDIHKGNPVFQRKLKHPLYAVPQPRQMEATHAPGSALLFLQEVPFEREGCDGVFEVYYRWWVLQVAFGIAQHHGELLSFDAWCHSMLDGAQGISHFHRYPAYLDGMPFEWDEARLYQWFRWGVYYQEQIKRRDLSWHPDAHWVLHRLQQSIFLWSDTLATQLFETGYISAVTPDVPRDQALQEWFSHPFASRAFSSMDSPLQTARRQMQDAVVRRQQQFQEERFFSIQAPTGAGKTFLGFHVFATFHQKDAKRLWQISPYTELAHQNYRQFQSVFSLRAQLYDAAPIFSENEEERWAQQQFATSAIFTTHVQWQRLLFAPMSRSVMHYVQLMESVWIIDEIQVYRNRRWLEWFRHIEWAAKWLNIRIVWISATLPLVSDFLSSPVVPLVDSPLTYAQLPCFRERVTFHWEWWGEHFSEERILDCLENWTYTSREPSRVLLSFLTKRKAYAYYQRHFQRWRDKGWCVELLTGDDCRFEKQRIIGSVVEGADRMLLISTSVVEAGMNIDMDVGFKERGLVDTDEQFAGRINRYGEREGHVFLFPGDDVSLIYSEDLRVAAQLEIRESTLDMLRSKDFSKWYEALSNELKTLHKLGGCSEQDVALQMVRGQQSRVAQFMAWIQEEVNFWAFVPYVSQVCAPYSNDELWAKYEQLRRKRKTSKEWYVYQSIKAKMAPFVYQFLWSEDVPVLPGEGMYVSEIERSEFSIYHKWFSHEWRAALVDSREKRKGLYERKRRWKAKG